MKDIYDDLEEMKDIEEDIRDDERDEELSRRKKRMLVIIPGSIFLSLLMLSYIFIGFPMHNVISGQIRSESPEGHVLRTQGLELLFLGNTLETATDAWHDNPDVETTLCIRGERDGNRYILEDAYKPEIFEQSFTHVRHEPCDDETILMFHTHPYKRCLASEADINTLRNAQRNNEDIVMMIMCEEDRFSIYT